MSINRNKRILRHLRLESFQNSYYPTDDHVRPFYGQSWKQVFRLPETRSAAKEYLSVYTEQFLFWKKCNLDDYPWLKQAIYKIDEIYMDVHKIVNDNNVSWLLDGLSKHDQNYEIIDAVNKMLVKRLSQSSAETRQIFEEAVDKDYALQEFQEREDNYYRLFGLERLVRKNGIEISYSDIECIQPVKYGPDKMSDLIKIGRYVYPPFFIQLIISECDLEDREKYSTKQEKKHNKWASESIETKILKKKRVVYCNNEEIKNLKSDLRGAKYIIINITSGALNSCLNEEQKEEVISSNKEKEVKLTAKIQRLQEINDSLQEGIKELESKLF